MNIEQQRRQFYDKIGTRNLSPLWESLASLITPEPRTDCLPCLWRFDELRPLVLEAGKLITAEEAERRVLVLENPALRGQSCITHSLYAGLQLILPGETAPAHRHTQTALRFVLEGEGAYTSVDGERTRMRPGDFIITPQWTFHDHGNESEEPVIWMDGLDIPLVRFLDASFAEGLGSGAVQTVTRPEGDSWNRYGGCVLPVELEGPTLTSPVFSYPYAHTFGILGKMHDAGPIDPVHGVKVRYINPTTGGHVMPTMSASLQLLPEGFRGEGYRCTGSTVYAVVEGRGTTAIGTQSFTWGPRDIFVVPSWYRQCHDAASDAVLFSFSDRPVLEKLGLWREAVDGASATR